MKKLPKKQQQEVLDDFKNKTEEYYKDGDYEQMSFSLEAMDEYGATYEKYYRVARLYDGMLWRIELLESEADFIREIDLEAEIE